MSILFSLPGTDRQPLNNCVTSGVLNNLLNTVAWDTEHFGGKEINI